MSILDIKAKGENGRWFNVEMQISEGMMFKELKKTIIINILDFNFIPDNQELHNLYKIINVATGKDDKLHDIFELHYIELKKFTKSYQQISSALDRWATFLTKADKLDKNHVPQELVEDRAIVKAIEAVDRMFDEDERLIYEVRMQALADMESKIASAIEKGMERGKDKAARVIALNLLKAGAAIEIISQSTGLSKAEIEQLMG